MDTQRRKWNDRQKKLNLALNSKIDPQQTKCLFFSQQAMLFSSELDHDSGEFSFEDDLWQGVDDDHARYVPKGCEHSIAWLIWHTTRCEDITMNLLVAGTSQVLNEFGWEERMHSGFQDTGNSMSEMEFASFNQKIDVSMLKGYRLAVGLRTRDIFSKIPQPDFKKKVNQERVARIIEEKAVNPDANYLIDYWGSRTIAGLILMPATRHHLVHINEALIVKKKIILQETKK